MKIASSAEQRRLGLYLALPGIVCLLFTGYLAFQELRYRAVAVPAVGKYTDEGGTPVGGDRVMFTYYITFQAKEGGSYQFVESGVDHQLQEGKPIPVLYDPADPKNARMAERNIWDGKFLLAPAGLLFVCLGTTLTRRKVPAPSVAEPATTAV